MLIVVIFAYECSYTHVYMHRLSSSRVSLVKWRRNSSHTSGLTVVTVIVVSYPAWNCEKVLRKGERSCLVSESWSKDLYQSSTGSFEEEE